MDFLELQRDSRVTTGNSGCLLCWPREVQSSIRVAKESWGFLSSDCRANRPHLGLCPEASVPLQGKVYVFVTHSHVDHFDPIIFDWDQAKYHIKYIISDDLPEGIPGLRMKPGDELELEDLKVRAFDSTDLGVSFYIEVMGRTIFHAGDLNLWHWREESTVREIKQAEEDFYEAVDPIRDLNIDLCMFPLDPRQGGLFDAGINHFVMSVKPRVVIPMHWQQRAEVPLNYARRGRTRYTEILALTKPRERADITFGEDELQIHVHTPVTGLFEEKKESEPLEERKDDPFTDTDLPVNVK